MNLIKKVFGWGASEDKVDEQFNKFRTEAKPFQIKDNSRIPLFPSSIVGIMGYAPGAADCHIHVKNVLGKVKGETDEYFFPINSNMNLKSYFDKEGDLEKLVLHFNLDKLNIISLEFDNESGDLTDGYIFKDLLCKVLYENYNGFSYVKAESDEEYYRFCKEIEPPFKSKPQKVINVSLSNSNDKEFGSLADQFNNKLNLEQPSNKEKQPVPIKQQQGNPQYLNPDAFVNIGKLVAKLADDKRTLLVHTGKISTIDEYKNEKIINPTVAFHLATYDNFDYKFFVLNDLGDIIFKKDVCSELNYDVNLQANSLKWLDFSKEFPIIMIFKFDNSVAAMNLKFLLAKCIVEANRKELIRDIFKKEEEWGDKYLSGNEKFDDKIVEEYDNIEEMSYHESYHNSQTDSVNFKNDNTKFTQARMLDRTFVTSGACISVFRDNAKNNLEYICSLPPVKDFRGKELNPSQIIMQEEDTKIVLLDQDDKKQVYYMDLEKGKIISELYADEGRNNSINNIAPDSKHSELTPNPVFLGVNARNIFKFDPRQGDGKKGCINSKIYSATNDFTSIASNKNGNFALGSKTGDIRLYKEVGQNAKNLYPGLGDPIIGLDSSKDGRWLLATCKNYILLVPTFAENKIGYTQNLGGGDKKPTPKKMIILPEDLAYLRVKDLSFSVAKFDDSENEKEKYIVAGFDIYLVFWTLKNVIQGNLDQYEIKKINDKINQNEFKFNKEDSMVVALPRQVMIQKTIRKKK